MKKSLSFIFTLVLLFFSITSNLYSVEFQVRILPGYGWFQKLSETSVGANLSFDFSPVTFRKNDRILFSAQGAFFNMFEDGIEAEQYIDFSAALGYSLRLSDIFYVYPEAFGGIWSVNENKKNKLPAETGYFYGARLNVDFHIMPEINISLFGGYKYLNLRQRPFSHTIQAGIGLTYNFTKGLGYSSKLNISDSNLSPIFPVFYAHYADNPFGIITITNNEEAAIKDVRVYFYNEQYMMVRTQIGSFNKIKQGESFDVELTALLNENILTQLSDSVTTGQITIEYKLLNKKKEFNQTLEFTTLSRNSMTWEDDRQAAAFVSPRDACAQKFARQIKSIVKSSLRKDIPKNIQYAGALFCVLKDYGINYVIDPSSAYSDNTGGLTVDFLQFPYQTLTYHGGDCDDLSIMNCSLLEAIGIHTAFITVPGHIFIAFDSGVSPDDSAGLATIPGGRYVIIDDTVWIPYEITLCTDTFDLALKTGYSQWEKAGENAALIPLADAWLAFKAVSVPESDASIIIPERETILQSFRQLEYE